VRATKDPLVFVVVFEDTAALLGIALAFTGILLSRITGHAWFEGAASIAIGLLLMSVATLLARESQGLLVGESADQETLDDVRGVASADPAVERIGRALTVQFGPETVVLNLELQFRSGLRVGDAAQAVRRIESALRRKHPELEYIFVEGAALGRTDDAAL
jgi:divalent metal cation (Fe/Co/Zn/Cd) transporter